MKKFSFLCIVLLEHLYFNASADNVCRPTTYSCHNFSLSIRSPPKIWAPQHLHLYNCLAPLWPFFTTSALSHLMHFFDSCLSLIFYKDSNHKASQTFYPKKCPLGRHFCLFLGILWKYASQWLPLYLFSMFLLLAKPKFATFAAK